MTFIASYFLIYIPSFNTVLHNARIRFANNLHLLDNSVVSVSCRL